MSDTRVNALQSADESADRSQTTRPFLSDRTLIGLALTATMLVAVFGLLARLRIMVVGLARPNGGNIYFRLFALHEAPFMVLLMLSALVAAVVLARRPVVAEAPTGWLHRLPVPRVPAIAIVALTVFAGAVAVWMRVHHEHLFSMDEFAADFQARIFADGDWRAALPAQWQPYATAMTPIFTVYQAGSGSWLTTYLPGYALLKAPFVKLGGGMLLNPLLAAGAVVAIAGVARRLWVAEGLRPWMAVAFLVSSSQFLLTSGTGYAMPAHLCLNLIWLWLYLREDTHSWAAALAVGALAFALHQPFPHALFVAPFMLRLLRRRRWGRLGSAVVVYGVAAAVSLAWMSFSNPVSAAHGGPGLTSVFSLPDRGMVWLHLTHLSLLLAWQAPLWGALLVVALVRLRRMDPFFSDLMLGVVLTSGFYLFFPTSQGHGWGYRYVYPVLGSLALLAAAGAPSLVRAAGARRAHALLGASLAIALLVQLPLRTWQAERFVRPFAAGERYVLGQLATVVVVRSDSIWYGRDLLRNNPYLRGQPVVVDGRTLSPLGRAKLEQEFPGRVLEVGNGELLELGMTRWASQTR